MKRLQLTDEEVALIEVRRRDEAKYNLSWNAALDAVIALTEKENMTFGEVVIALDELKKAVKP